MDLIQIDSAGEKLAQLMVEHNGDLKKVTRDPANNMNMAQVRLALTNDPAIRPRYSQLLAEKLECAGLGSAERVLKLVELQDIAMGDEEKGYLPDINGYIAVSKEISRVIAEAKGQQVVGDNAIIMVSKEGAKELLLGFLSS